MSAATRRIAARTIPQTIGNFLRDNPIYVAIAGLVVITSIVRVGDAAAAPPPPAQAPTRATRASSNASVRQVGITPEGYRRSPENPPSPSARSHG